MLHEYGRENYGEITCGQTRGEKTGNPWGYMFSRDRQVEADEIRISSEDFSSMLPAKNIWKISDHKHLGKLLRFYAISTGICETSTNAWHT